MILDFLRWTSVHCADHFFHKQWFCSPPGLCERQVWYVGVYSHYTDILLMGTSELSQPTLRKMEKLFSSVSGKILSSQISSYKIFPNCLELSPHTPTITARRCCYLQNSSKQFLLSSAKRLHISKGKKQVSHCKSDETKPRKYLCGIPLKLHLAERVTAGNLCTVWKNRRDRTTSSRQTLEHFFFKFDPGLEFNFQ